VFAQLAYIEVDHTLGSLEGWHTYPLQDTTHVTRMYGLVLQAHFTNKVFCLIHVKWQTIPRRKDVLVQ
jgi:hypothetical protein